MDLGIWVWFLGMNPKIPKTKNDLGMDLGMDLGTTGSSSIPLFWVFFFKIRIIFLFFNQYQNKHTVYPNPYPKRSHKLKNGNFDLALKKITQNRITLFFNI
jgi:hypothetical protein